VSQKSKTDVSDVSNDEVDDVDEEADIRNEGKNLDENDGEVSGLDGHELDGVESAVTDAIFRCSVAVIIWWSFPTRDSSSFKALQYSRNAFLLLFEPSPFAAYASPCAS